MDYVRAFLVGIFFSLVYWIGESVIHILIFHSDSWASALLPESNNEIWMRLCIVFLFIFASFWYEFLVKKKHEVTKNMALAYHALKMMREACLITDVNNKIVYVNPRYEEISGYSLKEVLGKNPSVLSSGKQTPAFYKNMWSILQTKGYWEGEIWNRSKDGQLFPEWIGISVMRDEHGKPVNYVGIFNDITSQKETEKRILRYANYDPLTDLPNRRYFVDQLEKAIKLAKRQQLTLAVMFLDVDHFKTINDQHGHLVGDEFLRQAAHTISTLVREVDIVSRFGGDEFVIMLPNIQSKNELFLLGKRLLSSLDQIKIKINSISFDLYVSIGAAFYPDDAVSAEALIRSADLAMYEVKKSTRHNIGLFSLKNDKTL